MLRELKNTETDSLQFRILDKNKEKIKEARDEKIENKEIKKSEVVEKPYIIQYK